MSQKLDRMVMIEDIRLFVVLLPILDLMLT